MHQKSAIRSAKDAKTLKGVQCFGLNYQDSVKTRNEPRSFELDLNEYSVLATLLSDMTMGLPPRAGLSTNGEKTAKSKPLFAIVMKDGHPFAFAGSHGLSFVSYTIVFGVRQKSGTSTEPTPTPAAFQNMKRFLGS